jgi:hypothetical protein
MPAPRSPSLSTMNLIRTPRRTAAPFLAAGVLLTVPAVASATTVEPVSHPGNPSCLDLGYEHELKFDPPSAGTKSGGGVTVELSLGADQYGQLVDWSSSKPIDAVIVKGGPNANAYVYVAESSGDAGLHAPFNGPDKYYGLSHVSFCWDDETPPVDEPPVDQPPVDPPPVVTPPAVTPPAVTPPAVTPPAVTPPAVTPPATGAVRSAEARSGRSRLRGPSGCVGRTVTATVSGREIAKVAFSLDGKRVKTVKGAGSFSVKSATLSAGIHRIKAKVTFKAAASTRSRPHVLTFQRCAVRRVAPRFAG